jgi:hypothetical protein
MSRGVSRVPLISIHDLKRVSERGTFFCAGTHMLRSLQPAPAYSGTPRASSTLNSAHCSCFVHDCPDLKRSLEARLARSRPLPADRGPHHKRGHRDGVRCDTTAELDMLTLIWVRGETMAFDLLPERSALPHLRQLENSGLF